MVGSGAPCGSPIAVVVQVVWPNERRFGWEIRSERDLTKGNSQNSTKERV